MSEATRWEIGQSVEFIGKAENPDYIACTERIGVLLSAKAHTMKTRWGTTAIVVMLTVKYSTRDIWAGEKNFRPVSPTRVLDGEGL